MDWLSPKVTREAGIENEYQSRICYHVGGMGGTGKN